MTPNSPNDTTTRWNNSPPNDAACKGKDAREAFVNPKETGGHGKREIDSNKTSPKGVPNPHIEAGKKLMGWERIGVGKLIERKWLQSRPQGSA